MTKKEFIGDLYIQRSEYKYVDQAITAAHLLDTVSSDIYSESQRFVFELIQNADDAAIGDNNEVYFDFHSNALIVSHNGHSFSENDISALTSAGSSTKRGDSSKTGYKGIGFKSVFGKSGKVTIISDGYQFRFDKKYHTNILPWQIIPIWTDLADLSEKIQVILNNKQYSVSTIIEMEDSALLEQELNELLSNGQILLFLRRVSKISVSNNGRVKYTIEKRTQIKGSGLNDVILYKNEKAISNWLTKIYDSIPVPESTKLELKKDDKTPKKLQEAEFTEISFAAKLENGKIKAVKDSESLIFTFLPTKVTDFRFPFLVNGSFMTNAAREGIHEDKVWNQWLFELIAEKTFDWLSSLVLTEYKYQVLHLLPNKFNSINNELKRSFDSSFIKHSCEKKFVVTSKGNIKKTSEVILDKTGLSQQNFIDPKSIIDFINVEKKIDFNDDCFVSPNVEESNKLKVLKVEIFELDNFETFFTSDSFKKAHKLSDNFRLIKYLKEKSDNDPKGIWFQTLKTLPFIYDEKSTLYNPLNGICFPTGINSTELGEIPIIHADIFKSIQSEKQVFDWLKKMGVKEPSQIAYVTNVIIPGIKKGDFITNENFLPVTHYLFRLFKDNQLDEEMLESLRELPLKIKNDTIKFVAAEQCFLSNRYQPQLQIEGIITNISLVSPEYIFSDTNELEWNLFFKALKVKDRIGVEIINNNNSLPTLRKLTSPNWVKACTSEAEKIQGAFGFGESNAIDAVKIPSFLNFTSENLEYSKLFWKNLIEKENHLASLLEPARYKYGIGYGQNRYSSNVENYFSWFVKNVACIPSTTAEILISEEIFINDKEIKLIAGDFLPVFNYDNPLPDEWKRFFRFKPKLELEDYLLILEKIIEHTEHDTSSKPPVRRIGMVYNKLSEMLHKIGPDQKKVIADWAVSNKFLSVTGNFEPPQELNWITIEGFSVDPEKIKLIHLPDNSDIHSDSFKELMSIFKIQTIDKFIPRYKQKQVEVSLKNKLQYILPFFAALVEKKKNEETDIEFDRMYSILNDTEFYTASEIMLSFENEDSVIEGPSLTVFKDEDSFTFKGKWKSERTLLSLIKELSFMLNVFTLNEELRFLLLESEESEIRDWLKEQGIHASATHPMRFFTQKDFFDTSDDAHGEPNVPEHAVDSKEVIDETTPENSKIRFETFTPQINAQDVKISSVIPIRVKDFEPSLENLTQYAEIESPEVRIAVGRWSEEYVHNNLKSWGNYTDIDWANEIEESGKPYDFIVKEDGIQKYIEVKGTPSENKDLIYLSSGEWNLMHQHKENYTLIRIFNAGKQTVIPEMHENPSKKLETGHIQIALRV